MFNNFSDEQLEAEVKKRKEAKRKVPRWVIQPLWWKLIFDWPSDFLLGLYLIIFSPIWGPFWVVYKIHKYNQQQRQNSAKEKGFDWEKYHKA